MRRGSFEHDVRVDLTLEHLSREDDRGAVLLRTDCVGHQGSIEPGRERRHEVPRLIRVRRDDERRRGRLNHRHERLHEPVGRVDRERGMLERDHLGDVRGSQPARDRANARAGQHDRHGTAQLLRRRNGLPRRAVQHAVFLLRDHQDAHDPITRTSSRSTRTSSLAASAGEPPSTRVCLDFCGR